MMIVLGLNRIHAGVHPRNNQVMPSFLNDCEITEETEADEDAFIIYHNRASLLATGTVTGGGVRDCELTRDLMTSNGAHIVVATVPYK